MPRVTKITVREGTTAQWATADAASGADPTRLLDAGEPGRDTDLNVLKFGNGTDTWADLPPAQSGTYVQEGVLGINPKHPAYGVTLDGVTDDTAGWILAIAAAKAAKLPIVCPAGTTKITGTLDCRCTLTSGNLSHLDDFKGIIGPGREALKFVQYTNNIPIFRFLGRYFKVQGFTAKFNTPQTPTDTAGNVFDMEDMIFFNVFDDLLIENGYLGFNSKDGDLANQGSVVFSNTFSNIRFRNNQYIHWRLSAAGGATAGGTGNHMSNIYMSSQGVDRMYRAIERLGGFEDVWNQLNIEHTVFEDCAFHDTAGDSIIVNGMHVEGCRFPCGSGTRAVFATNGRGRSKIDMGVDHCFFGPHQVSSITRSGATATATFALLDDQTGSVTGHGLRVGDTVVVEGTAEAEYSGTFTVTAVPSTTTFEYTVSGSPATPATLGAGIEYVTVAIGAALGSSGINLVRASTLCEIIELDLRIRDVRVTGKNATARETMLRIAAAQDTNARVKLKSLSTRGQMTNAHLTAAIDIVALTRASNVATAYTRVPHRLRAAENVFISTAVSGFAANAAVVAVTGPHSFTYNSTGADAALARVTGSLLVMRTYATTNRARSGNVATLTIGTHSLKVGMRVRVANIAGYTSADATVSAVAATTFSYLNTGADEATTADTVGAVMVLDSGISFRYLTEPAAALILEDADWLFSGVEALNLGTVAAGAAATQTTTHYGVRVGDRIDWSSMLVGLVPDGLRVTAYASAADTITWRGHNPTASDIVSGAILTRYRIGRN